MSNRIYKFYFSKVSDHIFNDSEAVCKYVTKHIGKDVDYDIVFKK